MGTTGTQTAQTADSQITQGTPKNGVGEGKATKPAPSASPAPKTPSAGSKAPKDKAPAKGKVTASKVPAKAPDHPKAEKPAKAPKAEAASVEIKGIGLVLPPYAHAYRVERKLSCGKTVRTTVGGLLCDVTPTEFEEIYADARALMDTPAAELTSKTFAANQIKRAASKTMYNCEVKAREVKAAVAKAEKAAAKPTA